MSPEKEISKRQMRREQIRKSAQRQRLIVVGLIVAVTLLLVVPIAYQMLKPPAEVVSIDPGTHPNANDNSMGATDAPIVIDEFSDFQCPYCKSFHTDTEPLLREHYVDTGKVRFVYRSMGNFVSDNLARAYNRPAKTESRDAALAMYCAGDQNKFWEMHAYLFANNMGVEDGGAFTDKRLKLIAETAGLEMDAFNSCYDGGKFEERVKQDAIDGQANGVDGTPAFVITYTVNGEERKKFIKGAERFPKFQQELEAALNEIGAAE